MRVLVLHNQKLNTICVVLADPYPVTLEGCFFWKFSEKFKMIIFWRYLDSCYSYADKICFKWRFDLGFAKLNLLSCLTLHKKMKFSIKNLFSKCDHIRRKLRIWSHLLKKSLMENFFLWNVRHNCFPLIQSLWLEIARTDADELRLHGMERRMIGMVCGVGLVDRFWCSRSKSRFS